MFAAVFLYLDGEQPTADLNDLLKLLTEPNPQLMQISETDKVFRASNFFALAILTSVIYWVKVFCVAFLNRQLKYSGV